MFLFQINELAKLENIFTPSYKIFHENNKKKRIFLKFQVHIGFFGNTY